MVGCPRRTVPFYIRRRCEGLSTLIILIRAFGSKGWLSLMISVMFEKEKQKVKTDQAMEVGKVIGSVIGVMVTIAGALLVGLLMAVVGVIAYDQF